MHPQSYQFNFIMNIHVNIFIIFSLILDIHISHSSNDLGRTYGLRFKPNLGETVEKNFQVSSMRNDDKA